MRLESARRSGLLEKLMRKWVAPDAWPDRLWDARDRAVRGKSAVAIRDHLNRLVQAG